MEKCNFCEKFDFATAKTEVNKQFAHIRLALCNTRFPEEEQFNFCPVCGRNLKEKEIERKKFTTKDSELQKYNNTEVEVIRPLTSEECDIEDVGYMYKVRFYDGYIRDVFEDELSEN